MDKVADLLAARFGSAAPEISEALACQTHRVQLAHRSIRAFTDEPLPAGLLDLILVCALSAPTSSNLNARTIIRVSEPARKARLAAMAGDQPWVAACPEFLVFCADLHRLSALCAEAGAPPPPPGAETLLLCAVDAALAGMNAMTAAEAAKLGAVMIGGLRERPEEVAAELALPPGVFALFGLCLGYPADPGAVRPRPAPEALVHRESYASARIAPGLRDYSALLAGVSASRGLPGNYLTRTARRLQPEAMRIGMTDFLRRRGFLP